jgi:hypothetical protein
MIVNLSEIDFVAGTVRATLLETWDDADDADPDNYPDHSFGYIYQSE